MEQAALLLQVCTQAAELVGTDVGENALFTLSETGEEDILRADLLANLQHLLGKGTIAELRAMIWDRKVGRDSHL